MEKTALLPRCEAEDSGRKVSSSVQRKERHLIIAAVLLAGCLLYILPAFRDVLGLSHSSECEGSRKKPFEWADIEPTATLEFHPCFNNYECARLDVPLDRSPSSTSTKRAAIALTKIRAKVPVTDPRYGGAILINPGGPGGSGVNAVSRFGGDVQTIVDPPGNPKLSTGGKYFDIIGFDPRGVNNTTPRTSCFPDDATQNLWAVVRETEGLASNETFSRIWSRYEAYSGSCSERMNMDEDDHVGRYVNTAVVVEDIISIVEALGEWREKRAQEEVEHLAVTQRAGALERAKFRKGAEKVLYWGFSYGTILGATLASMHPDRLERIALDGVADSEDYYDGYWLTNLQDTDLIMEKFHNDCYAAGPDKCALWHPIGSGYSQLILKRALQRLQKSPLPVLASGAHGPEIITYQDLMLLIRNSLYQPREWFPRLARIVKEIDRGNGTEFAALKQSQYPEFCRTPLCDRNPWSSYCHDPRKKNIDSQFAILCTDAPDHTDWTEEDHYQKFLKVVGQSKYLGAWWSEITMACAHWNLRPAWEYRPSLKGNTSVPILWISNMRDPVTPLRNAVKMSKGFPGSVVLRQDADGHCSLVAPSKCMAKWIRRYFQEGKTPPKDVLCMPDKGTFDGSDNSFPPAEMSFEDWEMTKALERLSREFGNHLLGF